MTAISQKGAALRLPFIKNNIKQNTETKFNNGETGDHPKTSENPTKNCGSVIATRARTTLTTKKILLIKVTLSKKENHFTLIKSFIYTSC